MLDDFVKPRYDEGGFASIPGRVRQALLSGQYDAVVLCLADGFGWRFIERFQYEPFLQRLFALGKLEHLTAQFPSTTAAHVTTIHTGQPVGEHGILEWFYYEPRLDRLIAPLLFSYAGDKDRDTLRSHIAPQRIFPSNPLYPAWRRQGIEVHVFGARDHTPSTYSKVVMHGAWLHPFKTFSEALINIGLLLERASRPTYVHLYVGEMDGICHTYGPTAPQTEAEFQAFLLLMEHFFTRLIPARKRVLFLFTADHGAVEVDPKTTIYLNLDPRFQGLERFLRTNRRGIPLTPAGSPRDMFLYIQEGMVDEAQAFLAERLEERAAVVKVDALIAEGYFGPTLTATFRERAGDLVILPRAGEAVWWYLRDKFEQKYYGHHGGLTPQEMEIGLFTCEVE